MEKINLNDGSTYAGFKVLYVKKIDEYRSIAVRLRHMATGTDVYHLYNDDNENLFSFCFKTPPKNDTGVAHIVEHCVLSGSSRFPLKEPFAALLNSSMYTFLNAMTFPDKTVYPAGSINEQDFYNLMLVYGDAVFSPLLREETFMQEACHLEDDKDINLAGVVFNEMKGAYSDPDSIAGEWAYRSLFPDTAYRHDSGGEPSAIPDLSYGEFLEFHKKYYHPSNCRIFLYGNIPTEKHLDFLEDNFLSGFSERSGSVVINNQPRWSKPIRVEKTFPVKNKDSLKDKSTVLINWLTVPVTDPYRVLIMEVLVEILIGNAGSPLRKALAESPFGEDLSPVSGLESELKELVFSVGIRGTNPKNADDIEALVFRILKNLSENGVDSKLIKAALHTVEFNNREIRGGGAPYALKLMRKTFRGWLHGENPEATLLFNPFMEKLKKNIGDSDSFFEKVIEDILLGNPHRSRLIVHPETKDVVSEKINKKIKNIKNKLSETDLEEITAKNRELKEYLEKPDSPENIKKIPVLELKDIPDRVAKIPCEALNLENNKILLFHDIYTNGVVYIDIAVDIGSLPDEAIIYLPVFGRAVCRSGIRGISYDEMAQRLALTTGGFFAAIDASSMVNSTGNSAKYIFFRMKTLSGDLEESLELIRELITGVDFSDYKRLKDLVIELRNDLKSALIPNGHYFAMLRAGSMLTEANKNEEMWKGITQLLFLNEFSKDIDKEIDTLASDLQTIQDMIVNGNRIIFNATAAGTELEYVRKSIERFSSALNGKKKTGIHESIKGKLFQKNKFLLNERVESVVVSSGVGYVAKVLHGARYGTDESAFQSVLAHLLRTGYLWEKIRMEGGAYGAFALHSGMEGTFTFASYRDPNIYSTLENYRTSLEFYKLKPPEESAVRRAVIGTVGREEKPMDPGEKGFVSLKRNLYGINDELRQKKREVMLGLKPENVSDSATQLLKEYGKGTEVVIAGREMINREASGLKALKSNITEIP